MARRGQIWVVALIAVAAAGAFLIASGRTGQGALWLNGEPDQHSSEISLFVFGSCHPDGEQIKSTSVQETLDSVVIDVRIRWPLGFGAPTCGSYEGTPFVVQLQAPLGDRGVYVLNPDSSIWPVQPSPFSNDGAAPTA